MTSCSHIWVTNSGNGGDPVFKGKMLGSPAMHVQCSKCNARTWFGEAQWDSLKEETREETQ